MRKLFLTITTFGTCLHSGAKREEVQGNHQQAIADNVGQIPTVFINGEVVTGAKPLHVYVEIIERKLVEENMDNFLD